MQFIFKYIDRFLNNITMYRLLAYGLGLGFVLSLVLASFGLLPYGVLPYVYSFVSLFIFCFSLNFIFAKIFKVYANIESWFITAMILYFILFPILGWNDLFFNFLASFFAIASKFIINYKGRHIFNPAGFGILALGLLGIGNAIWWVANPYIFIFTLVFGFLVAKKIRKLKLIGLFILISLFLTVFIQGISFSEVLLSWPIIFFASIMLTEPLTMPGTKKEQYYYVVFIAIFSSIPINFFNYFTNSFELSLILGNLLAFIFSSKFRDFLILKDKKEIAKDVFEFSFTKKNPLNFKAGQYLEWTLKKGNDDDRGNRRYFTIASSPTEEEVKLGVKFNAQSSSFKNKLLNMGIGEGLYAGSLSGDFILPENKEEKLAFIAGGIGITPFRSMLKYLNDTKDNRDIVLFYTVKELSEVAYKDLFDSLINPNFKILYIPTDTDGFINEEKIMKYSPNFGERIWYLSGPGIMVDNYKNLLKKMVLKEENIKTDYFPGF